MTSVFARISGWALLIVFLITACLPYQRSLSLRGYLLSVRRVRLDGARLLAHSWCGYVIAAGGWVHAWVPMSAGPMRGVDRIGLQVASVGLLLVLGQVILGLQLRTADSEARGVWRRLHFTNMIGLAAVLFFHLVRNGSTLRAVRRGLGLG